MSALIKKVNLGGRPINPDLLPLSKATPTIMEPAIKKIWVNNLCCQKYKQGIGAFRRGDRYDPLGVLIDLYLTFNISGPNHSWIMETHPSEIWAPTSDDPRRFLSGDYLVDGIPYRSLPEFIANWAKFPGLDPKNPTVEYRGQRVNLKILNDSFGLNFRQISSIIEEQL